MRHIFARFRFFDDIRMEWRTIRGEITDVQVLPDTFDDPLGDIFVGFMVVAILTVLAGVGYVVYFLIRSSLEGVDSLIKGRFLHSAVYLSAPMIVFFIIGAMIWLSLPFAGLAAPPDLVGNVSPQMQEQYFQVSPDPEQNYQERLKYFPIAPSNAIRLPCDDIDSCQKTTNQDQSFVVVDIYSHWKGAAEFVLHGSSYRCEDKKIAANGLTTLICKDLNVVFDQGNLVSLADSEIPNDICFTFTLDVDENDPLYKGTEPLEKDFCLRIETNR